MNCAFEQRKAGGTVEIPRKEKHERSEQALSAGECNRSISIARKAFERDVKGIHDEGLAIYSTCEL